LVKSLFQLAIVIGFSSIPNPMDLPPPFLKLGQLRDGLLPGDPAILPILIDGREIDRLFDLYLDGITIFTG
jgi:hypothetical protein